MVKKKNCILLITTLTAILTFLYSQFLWAIDLPINLQSNPVKTQNFLPSDLQENFSKDSCRIEVKPTDFSNLETFLALSDPYKSLQNHTQSGLNNEIGDIAYEKVFAESSQGTWIFESETKVVTEYKYGYDQYGQYEKTYENEIYREVSSNPLGTIIKAVVGIALTIFTGPAGLGLLAIQQAVVLAAANFVMNMLSGADIGQALLSAVISIAANVAGRILGGIVTGAMAGGENAITTTVTDALFSKATGFGGMDFLFQGLSLLNDLMVDEKGNSLFKQIFGKNGDLIFSVLQTVTGFLAGGIGDNSPPLGIRLTNAILSLAITGLTYALDGKIDPYLLQGLSTLLNQALSTWTELATKQAQFKEALGDLAPEGYLKIQEIKDDQGNITGYDLSSTDGKFKAELTAGLELKSIISQDGSLTQFDERRVPVYTKLMNGDLIAYDIKGNQMAYIRQGTEPIWENGIITKTKQNTEQGTIYYNNKVEFEAFIPQDNEPMYNADGRITGSYTEKSGITYIYNERGQLDSTITPAISNNKVQGYYIDTATNTTYTDNQGIPIWYRNNAISNGPVYFVDPFNQSISGQLLTKLDKNGLIQGFIYQDFARKEYTFYDEQGNQLLPAVNPEKIKQNLANVVIKLKEILTNQLDDIKEQYELTLNGSHEIDLTRPTSLIESLIDTLPLSLSAGSIILNLLLNTDDILQNIRLQNAIEKKDLKLIYDDTQYTPEQIETALNNYISQLRQMEIQQGIDALKSIPPQLASIAGLWIIGLIEPSPGGGEAVATLKTISFIKTAGTAVTAYIGARVLAEALKKGNLVEDISILFTKAQPKLKEEPPPLLQAQKDLNNNQMPQFDPEKFRIFIYAVMSSPVVTKILGTPETVNNLIYNIGTVGNVIMSMIGFDYLNQYLSAEEYKPLATYARLMDQVIGLINTIGFIEVLPNRSRFDGFELSNIDRSTPTGRAIYNAIYQMKYEKVYLMNLLNEGFVQWIGDTGIPKYDLPGAFEVNGKRFEIIFTNGIGNDETGVQKARNDLQKWINKNFENLNLSTQAKVGYIHNETYGLGGALDAPQVVAEWFGMVDDTSEFKAYYINEIMKADPNLTMILTDHSQGALKDDRTWDFIDNQYKDRIYVITNGGAQIGGYTGAAAVINIIKVGDLVPVGSIVKENFGGPSNEYPVIIPVDSVIDYIPVVGLNNHLYVDNYNYTNAQIITSILTRDPNENLNSIFKDLDYGSH